MKKKKSIILFCLIVLAIIVIVALISLQPTKKQILDYDKEGEVHINGSFEYKNYFCPTDDCELVLATMINESRSSVNCALYDLTLEKVIKVLQEKSNNIDVRLIMDDEAGENISGLNIKFDSYGLMHNKFCIVDNKIMYMGSFNPTKNGAHKENNDLVLLISPPIIQNYADEFEEMWNGKYKKGENVKNREIIFNDSRVVSLFCPEDGCEKQVLYELGKANESVNFMIFSFTDDLIGLKLVELSKKGILVSGVMEKSQGSNYSRYNLLKENNIDVEWDTNPSNLHHKVFIIDNKTVIFGSYNPTKNANTRNDENLMVVENEGFAKEFLKEFDKVKPNKMVD